MMTAIFFIALTANAMNEQERSDFLTYVRRVTEDVILAVDSISEYDAMTNTEAKEPQDKNMQNAVLLKKKIVVPDTKKSR
jgi:hypothetical protein